MYDESGRHVSTVVTREPEWDDRQRDKMLALTRYRESICPDCGYPKVFHDPRYRFSIDVDVCPVKAALDKFGRIQGEADEQVRKQGGDKRPAATPDPADGRRTLVRLVPPEDRGLRRRPPR